MYLITLFHSANTLYDIVIIALNDMQINIHVNSIKKKLKMQCGMQFVRTYACFPFLKICIHTKNKNEHICKKYTKKSI